MAHTTALRGGLLNWFILTCHADLPPGSAHGIIRHQILLNSRPLSRSVPRIAQTSSVSNIPNCCAAALRCTPPLLSGAEKWAARKGAARTNYCDLFYLVVFVFDGSRCSDRVAGEVLLLFAPAFMSFFFLNSARTAAPTLPTSIL